MKRCSLLFLAILSSCLTSNSLQYQTISTENQYHLARVRKGMSQFEVLRIMHKPYSYESFEFDGEVYDVWFYVTRPTGLTQTRMVPQNLTPLTFRNGILVGTGYNYYYYAMKEQAGEIEAQKPKIEKPKTQAEEDKSFEEALQKLQEQRTPPTQNMAPPQQAQPEPQVEPITPKAQKKTQDSHTVPKDIKAATQIKKVAPTQKKTPPKKKEKLPPNVHIIGQNEIPMKESENCFPQPAPFFHCLCPSNNLCDPNRFSVLTKGMKEKQVHRFFGEPIKFETFSRLQKGVSEETVVSELGEPNEKDTVTDGNNEYQIWYYELETKKGARTVPLTFKNGVLVGKTSQESESITGKPCKASLDQESQRMLQEESEQNFDFW